MTSTSHDQFVLVVLPAMQVAVSVCGFVVLILCCAYSDACRRKRYEREDFA